jgi:hypothetical protein
MHVYKVRFQLVLPVQNKSRARMTIRHWLKRVSGIKLLRIPALSLCPLFVGHASLTQSHRFNRPAQNSPNQFFILVPHIPSISWPGRMLQRIKIAEQRTLSLCNEKKAPAFLSSEVEIPSLPSKILEKCLRNI